ncbi:centromere protein N isoform X2 [Zootoca vivipara]|uniref:centromere protein N isoform X2 n=1 Tax=Zootoca vivipara TaxID=8524 RepID=UPI001591E319|nr:centromere protein N isoform X2 [Zootoca vivipara]
MSKRRRLNAEGFIMDEIVAEYIRRTVLRIPRSEMGKMLTTWGFLSETQLQSLNIHQLKENVSQEVVKLCEENHATIQHAADLDIIYNHTYRDKKLWTVYQMTREEGDEYDIFDLVEFKKKFKRSLQSALKNVTISFKEFEDNVIWIRIAWGTQYTKPNQYKPSYVAYISQAPYVFISNSRYRNCIPLLLQKFQTHHPQPLQERNCILQRVDPNIVKEDKLKNERIERINEEVFGDGPQPKLEFAQYKLETMFRNEQENGILKNKEGFRCLVKFSSPHLLESLKSLAPAGLADVPPSPLLTCITQKARNYFRINDRKSALSQTLAS